MNFNMCNKDLTLGVFKLCHYLETGTIEMKIQR